MFGSQHFDHFRKFWTVFFGMLRAIDNACAAGNTSLRQHLGLSVLHPDCGGRTNPNAAIAISAASFRSKNNRHSIVSGCSYVHVLSLFIA
jgi:hypothetical protein